MEYRFIAYDTGEENVPLEYIQKVEQQWNIQFPEVLKEYYLHHNMAVTKDTSFTVHGLEFYLNFMAPLCYGDLPVEKLLGMMAKKSYYPKALVPLAEDTEGDYFYWDRISGKVYYICRENVENPIPICDSVEAFIELLNNSCE